MDFDYPDFEEPQPTKHPVPDLSDFVVDDQGRAPPASAARAAAANSAAPGLVPQFNRALKPRSSSEAMVELIAKSSGLNNDRGAAREGVGAESSGTGYGLTLSNNLYPSMAAGSGKPEKNTNAAVDQQMAPRVSGVLFSFVCGVGFFGVVFFSLFCFLPFFLSWFFLTSVTCKNA